MSETPHHRQPVHGYERLRVWQEAMRLGREAYRLAARLPDVERFGLAAQMRRAAVSIPSNIAEGSGRPYPRERVRFLSFANGSMMELRTQVLFAEDLGYLAAADVSTFHHQYLVVGRLLGGLVRDATARAR